MPALATLKSNEKLLLTMVVRDGKGNEVPPTDPVSWATPTPTTLRIGANGVLKNTQWVWAQGPTGSGEVTVTDGTGLTKTVQIDVTAGIPASIDVTAGPPMQG